MQMLTELRRRHQNPQELGFQVIMSDLTWELRSELGSFTRAVHDLISVPSCQPFILVFVLY